jgi:hypothetical protein
VVLILSPFFSPSHPLTIPYIYISSNPLTMSVLKVIEIMSDSSKSWEDATVKGVAKAHKTLKGIKSAYVQSQSVTVGKDGKVSTYRVTLKISFEIL